MRFGSVDEFARSDLRPRVCIVGTGPAGISLALRLQSHGVPCLLIEAGGFEFSEASQRFYRGDVIGDPYHKLHEARLRQFGGTSGHWSGWVRSLDPCDFETRDYIPFSGWPIRAGDLAPYAHDADHILQVKPLLPNRPMTRDIDYIHYRFSPPVRFGHTYRDEIEQSRTIGLLLNSPVVEIVPGAQKIDAVKVAAGEGAPRDIRVDHLCVCTGGIENSRLLLWSNARYQGRVVPHATTLGRFWMEHPVHMLADALTVDEYEKRFEGHAEERWLFAPSDRARKAYGIGGAHVWMRSYQDNENYVKELVHDVMCVAPEWSNRAMKPLGKEYHCGAMVQSEFEQVPSPDNRVELDQRTDELGMPLSRLYWKKSTAERKTALTVGRLFGEALISADIGRLRIRNYLTDGSPWPEGDQLGGWHHMGGTRMSQSPQHGVVDMNCKVFGMDNLYIGGSSVFTTAGHASPTYTIVMLALRLGDHLADKLRAA
jgi:glycine/D-amino acid oxidase-like deaminating enzyme